MTQKHKLLSILLSIVIASTLLFSSIVTAAGAGGGTETNCELISVSVNGEPYMTGSGAVTLLTGQVFSFSVIMKNTGTGTWGQPADGGQYGATLFSRDPDYNDTFGTFFLSPGQGSCVKPGETFNYNMSLRAPAEPGEYTMKWQMAEWIIPYIYVSGREDYRTAPFYGDVVTVSITVIPRTETPPPKPSRVPGVIDEFDFVYEGSFSMPDVPGVRHDEKAFFESGITLRTVGGEKRLIMATGTYFQSLYEVAIPEPGKFAGNDYSAVPVAELRTVFGELPIHNEGYIVNGSMWYDESSGLFYWTNYHYYLTGKIGFPILRSARLDGGLLTEVQQWYQPENIGGAPVKSFWGGVTGIPGGFAEKYTGGRRLALGFGGTYAINSGASWGPSFAAAFADTNSSVLDMQPVLYSSINNPAYRDGNYFYAWASATNPVSPWQGTWTGNDSIRSGVFIDLPDKKGYITFVNQVSGRVGYDYGGMNWNGRTQNCWYFYDFDTLGKAAAGEISGAGLPPSSVALVDYPHDLTKDRQFVTGSCFDPETRRLYLYTLEALSRGDRYNNPVVHVYSVTEDESTPVTDDEPVTPPGTDDKPTTPAPPPTPALPGTTTPPVSDGGNEVKKWFEDVPENAWFYENVKYVYEKGLMIGTSETPMLFSPNITVTRGMVVTLMWRMAGEPVGAESKSPFPDVRDPGAYYYNAVVWAAANGIVLGYPSGNYRPADPITREQLAAIFYRYQQFTGKIPDDVIEPIDFVDRDNIAPWAREMVIKLTAQGIINGEPGKRFNPKGYATRAQLAAMTQRLTAVD